MDNLSERTGVQMNEEFYKQREQMRGQINMKDLIIKDQKEIISELCQAVEQLHNAINEINNQRSDNPNPLGMLKALSVAFAAQDNGRKVLKKAKDMEVDNK